MERLPRGRRRGRDERTPFRDGDGFVETLFEQPPAGETQGAGARRIRLQLLDRADQARDVVGGHLQPKGRTFGQQPSHFSIGCAKEEDGAAGREAAV